ncbi:MAG: DUF3710 domain-containing protein [Galactobacter sp.]
MFGRKKKRAQAEDVEDNAQQDANEQEAARDEERASSETGRRAAGGVDGKSERKNGPWDASEVEEDDSLIDLGSLRIKPVAGMNLNLEVEQGSQAIVAVALELNGSRVQIQAFSASKSESLWPGISAQIDESVTSQGGRTDRRDGRFGEELLARVPATGPDGSQGVMIARFVGIDGPRWFLRAVFAGQAAINEESASALEDLLASVVVDRGSVPMPPTELLPLRVPEQAAAAAAAQEQAAEESSEETNTSGRDKPERGPEMTETR